MISYRISYSNILTVQSHKTIFNPWKISKGYKPWKTATEEKRGEAKDPAKTRQLRNDHHQ